MLQVLIFILYGLAGVSGLGFVASVMIWSFGAEMNLGAIAALALLTLFWIGLSLILQRFTESPRKIGTIITGEKAKHESIDMYSMIDRLVHELNSDEREYLQQRLNETLQRDDDDELVTTLEELLAERDEQHMRH